MGQDVEIGIRGLPLPLTGGVVVVMMVMVMMVMVVTVMVVQVMMMVMMVVHFDFVVCLKVRRHQCCLVVNNKMDGGENNVDEM